MTLRAVKPLNPNQQHLIKMSIFFLATALPSPPPKLGSALMLASLAWFSLIIHFNINTAQLSVVSHLLLLQTSVKMKYKSIFSCPSAVNTPE